MYKIFLKILKLQGYFYKYFAPTTATTTTDENEFWRKCSFL